MKLYVCSNSDNGIKDIAGIYYLITETGECLATHFCSAKQYAKGDLYEKPERKERYIKRFGECECLYLGEDDMTFDKLIELSHKLKQKEIEDSFKVETTN